MDDDVRVFFEGFAAAHAREDVEAYVGFFTDDTVWVTSRGVCYRGREELGAYLREVIPGGLGDGTVHYVVESVHPIGPATRLAVVAQTYLDHEGAPRDERAAHTHTYVLTGAAGEPLIAAEPEHRPHLTRHFNYPQAGDDVTPRPSYVVTGAAGGVGRSIAQHLAEHGHVVILDVATSSNSPTNA